MPAEKNCHPAIMSKITLNLHYTLSFTDLWNTKSNQVHTPNAVGYLSIKGMNATDAIYNLPKPVQ